MFTPCIDCVHRMKMAFLENRCNTLKKADTVALPLRDRFQKLKTVVTSTYVTPLKKAETVSLFHIESCFKWISVDSLTIV
jgi:hypothetical protein